MSRPTEFFVEDEMVYWYITIVASDGTPLDADADPTVAYRRDNGAATTTTGIVITKVGTGLYRARHQTSLDGLIVLDTFLHYEETAIISGVSYKNNWTTIVRGVATLVAQTSQSASIATMQVVVNGIDTRTNWINAVTNQMVFTVANQLDCNSLTGGTSPSAVADAVWDEAMSAHQSAGSTGKGLTDAAATGGDATAANQNTIIGKLAAPAVVYTNPSSPNKLTIVRGDAYDDSTKNNGKLTWATGKTLAGASIRFTIRDANDAILIDQTTAGVTTAVNVQAAEVSLTTAATNLLTVATTNKFDAEAYWDADDRWTFARGQCTVLEDQTRT